MEHPVTELVSGEDLVEHMINAAAGKKLPNRLTDTVVVPFKGHAVEARVYAEDPLRNFSPSIGILTKYQEPLSLGSTNIRCDTGIEGNSLFSLHVFQSFLSI